MHFVNSAKIFSIVEASGSRIPANTFTVPVPFHFEYSSQPAADADVAVKVVTTSERTATAAPASRPFFFSMWLPFSIESCYGPREIPPALNVAQMYVPATCINYLKLRT